MKTLFVFDGTHGYAKTDLFNFLIREGDEIKLIKKDTSRELRIEEKPNSLDFKEYSVTESEFEKRKKNGGYWVYQYGPEDSIATYGFSLSDIDNAFDGFDFALIIMRHCGRIRQLKKVLQNKYNVISVFVYSDRELTIKRMEGEKATLKAIEYRKIRLSLVWTDYILNMGEYDEVLINNASANEYEQQLHGLTKKYSQELPQYFYASPSEKYLLIHELHAYKQKIQAKLEHTNYSRNIFLMMKFRNFNIKEFQAVEKIIKDNDYNCVCLRNEHPVSHLWDITKGHVKNPIAVTYCCKYGIALIDEPDQDHVYSPNVMYEIGFMHSQDKECLIIRKKPSVNQIPFDLLDNIIKEYNNIPELESTVNKWIRNLPE